MDEKYFKELKNMKKALPHIYYFPMIRGMTSTEIRMKMKIGSEAYFRENYERSIKEYTSVFNAVNIFGCQYLCITEKEFLTLTYALANALSFSSSKQDMDYALSLFTSLKKDNFPAAYYGKAKLLINKYERYQDGKMCCISGLSSIENNCVNKKYTWPGTLIIIEETKTENLKVLLNTLKKSTSQSKQIISGNSFINNLHFPSENSNYENIPLRAECRYDGCSLDRNIKTTCSSDGYYIIQCTNHCYIYYHSKCWRLIKKSKILINSKKEFLSETCLTPDCNGIINIIEIYNKKNELQKQVTMQNGNNFEEKYRKNKLERRMEKKELKKQRTKTLSSSFDDESDKNITSEDNSNSSGISEILLNNEPKKKIETNRMKEECNTNFKQNCKKNEISQNVLLNGKIEPFKDLAKENKTWNDGEVEWNQQIGNFNEKENCFIDENEILRKKIQQKEEEILKLIRKQNEAVKYCFELKKNFCLDKMGECIITAEKNMSLLQNRYLSQCSCDRGNINIVEEISRWQKYIDECNAISKKYIDEIDLYLERVAKDNLLIDLRKFDVPLSPSKPQSISDWQVMVECPICFEIILSPEEECTPCDHKFHKKCLEVWKKKNSSCPVCRTPIRSCQDRTYVQAWGHVDIGSSEIDEDFPPL